MADTVDPVEEPLVEADAFTSVRRRMLRGSAWVMGGKVGTILLGVAFSALITRLLEPNEVGAYLTTYSLVVIGAAVAQFGLDRAVVRFVSGALGASDPGRARAAIRKVFTYGTGGAVLAALVLAFGLGSWLADNVFRSDLVAGIMPIAIGWLVVTALQSLFVETFRGLQRFDLSTILDALLVDALTAAVLAAVFVLGVEVSLAQVAWLSAGATLVAVVIAAAYLVPRYRSLVGGGDVGGHEIFAFAWPLLITNIAILLLGRGVDLWVLGAFRGQADVALYGAASRLVVFVATPFLIVQGVTPPIVAELHAQGRVREMERALRGAATVAGLPSFLVLVFFVVLGSYVMRIVYGPFYADGATVLVILSIGRLIAVWTGSCAVVLMMTGHQRMTMYVTLAAGIMSVGGGILVANQFGRVGVATTTALAQVVQNLVQLVLARRLAGVWTHIQLSPRAIVEFLTGRGLKVGRRR